MPTTYLIQRGLPYRFRAWPAFAEVRIPPWDDQHGQIRQIPTYQFMSLSQQRM
jgi:hypothetical protein